VRVRAALAALIAVAAAGCGGAAEQAAGPMGAPSRFEGTDLGGTAAPDFALRDQQDRPVRLSALRGKFVLVTFLYTHCPDVCPLIADNLDVVLRRLGSARDGVRVLAVSVDPLGDTPAAARRFVRVHAPLPQFRFLLGTRRELARVWRKYHIAVEGGPEQTVNHSSYTLLVDRNGKERVLYGAQVTPREVLHDLRTLEQG
jgi:protein SCO1